MIIVIVTAHATLKLETSDVEAAIARRVGEETVLAHSKVRLLQEANSILMEQKTMHEEHLNEALEQLAAQTAIDTTPGNRKRRQSVSKLKLFANRFRLKRRHSTGHSVKDDPHMKAVENLRRIHLADIDRRAEVHRLEVVELKKEATELLRASKETHATVLNETKQLHLVRCVAARREGAKHAVEFAQATGSDEHHLRVEEIHRAHATELEKHATLLEGVEAKRTLLHDELAAQRKQHADEVERLTRMGGVGGALGERAESDRRHELAATARAAVAEARLEHLRDLSAAEAAHRESSSEHAKKFQEMEAVHSALRQEVRDAKTNAALAAAEQAAAHVAALSAARDEHAAARVLAADSEQLKAERAEAFMQHTEVAVANEAAAAMQAKLEHLELLAQVKNDHSEAVGVFEARHEELERKIANARDDAAAAARKTTTLHEEELQQLRRTHQLELETRAEEIEQHRLAAESARAALDEARLVHDSELAEEDLLRAEALEELEEEHEREIAAREEESAAHARDLAIQIEDARIVADDALAEQAEAHRVALKSAEAERLAMAEQHEVKTEAISAEHAVRVAEHAARLREMKRAHAQMSSNAREDAAASKAAAIAQTKVKHLEALEVSLAARDTVHDESVSHWERRVLGMKQDIAAARDELTQARQWQSSARNATADAELEERCRAHVAELAAQSAAFKEDAEVMSVHHRRSCESLSKQHTAAVARLRVDSTHACAAAVAEARRGHSDALAARDEEHARSMEHVRERHLKELKRLKLLAESEQETLTSQHVQVKTLLEEKLAERASNECRARDAELAGSSELAIALKHELKSANEARRVNLSNSESKRIEELKEAALNVQLRHEHELDDLHKVHRQAIERHAAWEETLNASHQSTLDAVIARWQRGAQLARDVDGVDDYDSAVPAQQLWGQPASSFFPSTGDRANILTREAMSTSARKYFITRRDGSEFGPYARRYLQRWADDGKFDLEGDAPAREFGAPQRLSDIVALPPSTLAFSAASLKTEKVVEAEAALATVMAQLRAAGNEAETEEEEKEANAASKKTAEQKKKEKKKKEKKKKKNKNKNKEDHAISTGEDQHALSWQETLLASPRSSPDGSKKDASDRVATRSLCAGRQSDQPLAPGWRETKDVASGGSYYFHKESGETTWNRGVACGLVQL